MDPDTVIVESSGALLGQPVGSVDDPRSLARHNEAASEDHRGRSTPSEESKVRETEKDMCHVDPRPDRQEPQDRQRNASEHRTDLDGSAPRGKSPIRPIHGLQTLTVGEQAGSILRTPFVSTTQALMLKTEESNFSVHVMSWPTCDV